MNKIQKNQTGFAPIEVLVIILILAVVCFGGYYVWHTQHMTKTTTSSSGSTTSTTSINKTRDKPVSFVESVYKSYADGLTAVQKGPIQGTDNPDLLQALQVIKADLSDSLYQELAAATTDISGGGYLKDKVACKPQGSKLDSKAITASLVSSNSSSAIVSVKLSAKDASPVKVTVDASGSKITQITCPS